MIGLKLTAIVGAAGLALSGATYLKGRADMADIKDAENLQALAAAQAVAIAETDRIRARERQLQEFANAQSQELSYLSHQLAEAEADARVELDTLAGTVGGLRDALTRARRSESTGTDTTAGRADYGADWERVVAECTSAGESLSRELVRMATIADDRKLRLDAAQQFIRIATAGDDS